MVTYVPIGGDGRSKSEFNLLTGKTLWIIVFNFFLKKNREYNINIPFCSMTVSFATFLLLSKLAKKNIVKNTN